MTILSQISTQVVDFLIPPQCANCKKITHSSSMLCHDCWQQVDFITHPYCNRCGHPLPFEQGELTNECMHCLHHHFDFDHAMAATVYSGLTKDLILRYKHSGNTALARVFAGWIYPKFTNILKDADYIIPVPLHWTRLVSRGFNQSVLLIYSLCKLMKNDGQTPPLFLPNALTRDKKTPSQGHLKATDRFKNVEDVFSLKLKYGPILENKNVILIDDVITSGATASSCASVLKKYGTKYINVVSIARSVKHL